MSKKREFSAKDLDKIILSGKSIRAAEFEDEVGETDAEGILEELLEQVLLDTDIISVDRISTFEEAGEMCIRDSSCMSLEYRERNAGAVQWKTVPHAIELGAMVAFLIRKDDKNINLSLIHI